MSTTEVNAAAPRFRQRKISLKQQLRVLSEQDLPGYIEDVRGDLLGVVETGVDKNEEDERHLQAVLNSAAAAKKSKAFIPTPKASAKWPAFCEYYSKGFVETESYLRCSATVEDAQASSYYMDEQDDEFLQKLNSGIKNERQQCTMDEFELCCSMFEDVVADTQKFLTTNPQALMSYTELEPLVRDKLEKRQLALQNPIDPERLLSEAESQDYARRLQGSPYRTRLQTLDVFGAKIYVHWRERKIARGGQPVAPTLRFESGLPTDDSDPYVCFRRREVRHTRKTRRTDQQTSGILRRLHSEMHQAQSLLAAILDRERTRLKQIKVSYELFQMRSRVKAAKRRLRVGPESDDVELLVSVPKRVIKEEQARQRRMERDRERKEKAALEKQKADNEKREASEPRQLEPKKTSSTSSAPSCFNSSYTITGMRVPEHEHITPLQQPQEQEATLMLAIDDKMQKRQEADRGWVNVTDNRSVPYLDFFTTPPPSKRAKLFHGNESHYDPRLSSAMLSHDTTVAGDIIAGDKDHGGADYSRVFSPYGEAHDTRQAEPDTEPFSTEDELINLSLRRPVSPTFDTSDLRYVSSHSTRVKQLLAEPRLPLTSEDDDIEAVECKNNQISPISMLDFAWHPGKFYVDKRAPHATVRGLEFGSFYIDRNLDTNVTEFARMLKESPRNAEDERLLDRYKFANAEYEDLENTPWLFEDPARLNNIDPGMQDLRFASVLLASTNEFFAEAQSQRRRAIQAVNKRQQQQQQQQQQQEQQKQTQQQQHQVQQRQQAMKQQQQQQLQQQQRQQQQRIQAQAHAHAQQVRMQQQQQMTGSNEGGNGSRSSVVQSVRGRPAPVSRSPQSSPQFNHPAPSPQRPQAFSRPPASTGHMEPLTDEASPLSMTNTDISVHDAQLGTSGSSARAQSASGVPLGGPITLESSVHSLNTGTSSPGPSGAGSQALRAAALARKVQASG